MSLFFGLQSGLVFILYYCIIIILSHFTFDFGRTTGTFKQTMVGKWWILEGGGWISCSGEDILGEINHVCLNLRFLIICDMFFPRVICHVFTFSNNFLVGRVQLFFSKWVCELLGYNPAFFLSHTKSFTYFHPTWPLQELAWILRKEY